MEGIGSIVPSENIGSASPSFQPPMPTARTIATMPVLIASGSVRHSYTPSPSFAGPEVRCRKPDRCPLLITIRPIDETTGRDSGTHAFDDTKPDPLEIPEEVSPAFREPNDCREGRLVATPPLTVPLPSLFPLPSLWPRNYRRTGCCVQDHWARGGQRLRGFDLPRTREPRHPV